MSAPEQGLEAEGAAGEEVFPHQRARLQALVSHFGFGPQLQRPGEQPLFIKVRCGAAMEPMDDWLGRGWVGWRCGHTLMGR
jgi:hypothetical protein